MNVARYVPMSQLSALRLKLVLWKCSYGPRVILCVRQNVGFNFLFYHSDSICLRNTDVRVYCLFAKIYHAQFEKGFYGF